MTLFTASSEDGSRINCTTLSLLLVESSLALLSPTNASGQLCALSTVGIAPSGLALGRVERSKPSIFRRKTLPYEPLPTSTELATADVRPKTSRSVRLSQLGVECPPSDDGTDGSDRSHTGQLQGPDLRRTSLSFGAGRFRRRGQTLTNLPLRIPENEPTQASTESHSRRPSTGWLRRLSLVSFQTESQSTSSPVTPSFNGSASPILSRPTSQRRAPNKLVKRSSSQHSNAHPLFINTSVPTSSASRRPATSYQRSETMRLQSPLTDFGPRFPASVETPVTEEFDIHTQNDWRPYLHAKSEGLQEKLSRRLSTTGSPKVPGVRRIVYDQDTAPALVPAATISCKISTSPEEGRSSVTPVQFRDPFEKSIEPPPTPPRQRPPHKHSYSLNDAEPKRIVVNTVTASGTPIPGQPGGGSLKRVKGRTFSIPRSELSKIESSIKSSPVRAQRRNITDPSVFHRPHTIAMADRDLSLVAPRSASHDYNIGLRGQRPLTSDAVALSAWQHANRRDSYTYSSLRRRPKRHSIAASDPASTIIGSDDTRIFTSCDEGETDMTDYWDSVRTRETSGSGLKGLRIETMFDKAGARLSNEEITTLEELLPRGSFASGLEKNPSLLPGALSSPPMAQAQVTENASIISADDEDACSMIGALPGEPEGPARRIPLSPPFSSPSAGQICEVSSAKLPPDPSIQEAHTSQKMNIFDWSEQMRSDRDLSDTEARPRTVHGKQNGVDRGSRAACRKVPSSIHLRSQSVPIARDLPVNDSRQTSGKFGTWGLGSKGVSEDWDSDFDFDDAEEPAGSQAPKTQEMRETAQESMTVPKAILERQASLRGQYGHVQELTLLVQELKRLRHQASILNLVEGPSGELWKEAEGIVNLATIDDEEERRSPPGSPSSLTFSFDDSDEEALNASPKRNSEGSWQGGSQQPGQLSPPPSRHSGPNSEISWREAIHEEGSLCNPPLRQPSNDPPKSKSVLDILQPAGRPTSSTFPDLTPAPRPQKLPFDTQSLRDLVVRAGVVTRALKEVIRKAEGVDASSQGVLPSDPPFRRIFDQPSPSHDGLASFEAALAEMN